MNDKQAKITSPLPQKSLQKQNAAKQQQNKEQPFHDKPLKQVKRWQPKKILNEKCVMPNPKTLQKQVNIRQHTQHENSRNKQTSSTSTSKKHSPNISPTHMPQKEYP